MINSKDVIRMKIPYPSINSNMAVSAHMYICRNRSELNYEYIKCQTLKPYMLINSPMTNYHDESPDITRNPFTKKTRIDCDKLFLTSNVSYDIRLKATTRPDVSDDLFNVVQQKLSNGYSEVVINECELKSLNTLIR